MARAFWMPIQRLVVRVKKLLGIDEDYYVAVPPDPTAEEMEGVLITLKGLTQDAAGPKQT